MLFDRVNFEKTVIKVFKSKGLISCVYYGPYDNGHILIGTTTGDFYAFSSMSLQRLCHVKISDRPITSIAIEPTQLVLVGVADYAEITALTFIEAKQRYIYMEIGTRRYATVVL